jgi:hypothetical protein
LGTFAGVVLTNLNVGTLYHVRAWVSNTAVVAYGSDILFSTHCAITASAGPHGTILPNGWVEILCGSNATFTITPDSSWQVANVLVDSGSVGATNSYTFISVTTNHTISASFSETYTTNGTPQSWLDHYGLTNDLSDTDGDGMKEWEEYKAGTDPTNAASCLLVNIGQATTADVLVSWSNTGTRTYYLWARPDMLTGSWQTLEAYTNFPCGTTWYTNGMPTNAAFFRVTVVNTNQ